jgi:hypothetical protein
VFVGVGVSVGVGVFVAVSVGVGVFVGVSVGVGVLVAVGVFVGVGVGVFVAVCVGVAVFVGVGVSVGVGVGVGVFVDVGVFVGVGVGNATVMLPLATVRGMANALVVSSATLVSVTGLTPSATEWNVRMASVPLPDGPAFVPSSMQLNCTALSARIDRLHDTGLPVLPRNPPSLTLARSTTALFHVIETSYLPRSVTLRARTFAIACGSATV